MKTLTLTKMIGVGLIGLSILGCGPKPTIKMRTETESKEMVNSREGSRYSIKRVAVFEDDLAYENKRGIYEIIDNKTGHTYLGVSGIGITELGSHSVTTSTGDGETTTTTVIPDER
jgi:hypothetical protein